MALHKSQVHYSGFLLWWACSSLMSFFSCRGRLRTCQADCFMVCLYCVTITWQQIFKDSLKLMVEGFLRLNADFLAGRLTHETVNADSEKVRSFVLCDKKHGWIRSNISTSLKTPLLVWDCECEQYAWTELIAQSYYSYQASLHQWPNYRGLSQGAISLKGQTFHCMGATSKHSEKNLRNDGKSGSGWL